MYFYVIFCNVMLCVVLLRSVMLCLSGQCNMHWFDVWFAFSMRGGYSWTFRCCSYSHAVMLWGGVCMLRSV